jgi:hypothetical protein
MARPHPALVELAAGRPLPGISDFEELLRSAFEHRMHGLLWTRVQNGELSGPPDWEQRIAMLSLRDEARHLHLWETLQAVTETLSSIGAGVATLKGVAAEKRWYERIGERPCYDADVLLSPHDTEMADQVVEALEPGNKLVGRLREQIERGTLQFVELHAVDGTRVDLHFDALKMRIPCRQAELLWSRTVDVENPTGGAVRAYDTELSLLYFLLHMNRDRFRSLLGFADIARILRERAIDWHFIDSFAREEGIEVPVYASLDSVCSTLGIDNPAPAPEPGWRLWVWTVLWRHHVRLQGDASIDRYRNRGRYVLPLLASGRGFEAARLIARRALS